MEVRFRGRTVDQAQTGSDVVRARCEVAGPRSGFASGGGAVVLMVELLSCRALVECTPLTSYRDGSNIRVYGYGQFLRAISEVVQQSGHTFEEYALHSQHIGGASAPAAGCGVSKRVIQTEGRRKPHADEVYTRNNNDDVGRVSRKLAEVCKGVQRQPGQGIHWEKP